MKDYRTAMRLCIASALMSGLALGYCIYMHFALQHYYWPL